MTKVIERNTNVPTRRSIDLTALLDASGRTTIRVLAGEREFAAYNKPLFDVELRSIESR